MVILAISDSGEVWLAMVCRVVGLVRMWVMVIVHGKILRGSCAGGVVILNLVIHRLSVDTITSATGSVEVRKTATVTGGPLHWNMIMDDWNSNWFVSSSNQGGKGRRALPRHWTNAGNQPRMAKKGDLEGFVHLIHYPNLTLFTIRAGQVLLRHLLLLLQVITFRYIY